MQDRDIQELQRLWDLREKGAISEEEFSQLKQRILDQKAEASSEPGEQPADIGAAVARSAPPKSATPPNYGKIAGIGCAVVLGLFLIIAVIGSSANQNTSQSLTNETGSTADLNAAATDSNASGVDQDTDSSSWTYSQDEDKVRGGTTYYASTTSTNSIAQDPPYDSDTTMRMSVRKSPAYGTDVILTISSGQMMCPSFEGCSGTVRFDNGPAQHVRFNGPADESSDTVFVVGAKQFIARLKSAKKVTIEKTLYQAGSPQFEFDVHGLKWDH